MSSIWFNHCDEVFGFLTDQHPARYPLDRYPIHERVVVAVWHYSDIIDNGGFCALIGRDVPGDEDFAMIVFSFHELAIKDAFEPLDELITIIRSGDGSMPDRHERLTRWLAIAEEVRLRLERRFWSSSEQIAKSLSRYILDHGIGPNLEENTDTDGTTNKPIDRSGGSAAS